jgi:hypothetical protein
MIDNLYNLNQNILSEAPIKEYLGLEDIKSREIETLNRLCQFLKVDDFYHYIFENYYLNYQIPQIGKEFDLLRIGEESIINIELKSEKVDNSDILKQLERNYYYLSFLKKKIYCYTFVTDGDTNILYYYNKRDKTIEEVNDINELITVISNLKDIDENNIDNLFTPSNYLISPFNTTDEFIKDEYFLTKQQEQIEQDIIKKIVQDNTNKIFSISGIAGTGKTLLTYDIAKKLRNIGKNITIIHCAQANNGIHKLNAYDEWNIKTINNYSAIDISTIDILIFDEAHRLSKSQLDNILQNTEIIIIFSHDVNQKLNCRAELTVKDIEDISNQNKYKLTKKVRHNTNLASFIKKFFDLSKIKSDNISKNDYDNISFYYTQDIKDAEQYITYLKSLDWEHIYLTPSRFNSEHLDTVRFSSTNSSHQVIGQEYDNVVISINKPFYYTDTLKLSYSASYYYNPLETLFQAITRTRKKLTLVIIDNESMYKSCIKIINRCPVSPRYGCLVS